MVGAVMPMYMEIIQAYAKYYGAFAKHIVIPKTKKKTRNAFAINSHLHIHHNMTLVKLCFVSNFF